MTKTKLTVRLIAQLAEFMGVRASENCFEPVHLHLQPVDLLEQLSWHDLSWLIHRAVDSPCEQLAGSILRQSVPLSLRNGVESTISGNLLDRVRSNERLHSGPRLGLVSEGAGHAHRCEHLSGEVARRKG